MHEGLNGSIEIHITLKTNQAFFPATGRRNEIINYLSFVKVNFYQYTTFASSASWLA